MKNLCKHNTLAYSKESICQDYFSPTLLWRHFLLPVSQNTKSVDWSSIIGPLMYLRTGLSE